MGVTRAELVQAQTDHLLHRLLRVFDRAVRAIPADHLGFRPTPRNMSACEMAHHVYHILLISAIGVRDGACSREAAELPPAPEHITDPAQLAEIGRRVRDVAEPALAALTEAQLDREIAYYFGMRATGLDSLRNLTEELLHHRGQLQVYLRLMGVEPPSIRDFS
jgi:uncharacterized damage-inducible protein DinB